MSAELHRLRPTAPARRRREAAIRALCLIAGALALLPLVMVMVSEVSLSVLGSLVRVAPNT